MYAIIAKVTLPNEVVYVVRKYCNLFAPPNKEGRMKIENPGRAHS